MFILFHDLFKVIDEKEFYGNGEKKLTFFKT